MTTNKLQANLGADKKSSLDRLKTQKGGLGKSQGNKKGKTIRGMLSKVLSQNLNCKSLQSRFEISHGCVSSSQTLIYPLLPLPSQSIFVLFFFKKKDKKKTYAGTTAKLMERAMQITHARGLPSSRLGNNDVKNKKEQKANPPKVSERKRRQESSILQGRHKSAIKINE